MNATLNRSLSGVFCDDIRHELHGKKSLIGVYSGVMEVSEFPALLSKLCVHVILQTPGNEPFRSVKLFVLKDEEQVAEGELMELPEVPAGMNDPLQLSRIDAQFVFSPFAIEKPCTLKVRAHADGTEIRGLALTIRQGAVPVLSAGEASASEVTPN